MACRSARHELCIPGDYQMYNGIEIDVNELWREYKKLRRAADPLEVLAGKLHEQAQEQAWSLHAIQCKYAVPPFAGLMCVASCRRPWRTRW